MKRILVVVDMQKDFIDGTLGTVEAAKIVPDVITKIKQYQENNDTIYFTQDTHESDYLQTQEGKNLPVAHCIRGTEGWELETQINALKEIISKNQENQVVFEKGIFGSEHLAQHIRQVNEQDQEVAIELVGLCTDICVLSNAILFKTYMPEVSVIVDAKCCAGVTPTTHKNALEALKMCQIKVINE